jgi:hypothetical protein
MRQRIDKVVVISVLLAIPFFVLSIWVEGLYVVGFLGLLNASFWMKEPWEIELERNERMGLGRVLLSVEPWRDIMYWVL